MKIGVDVDNVICSTTQNVLDYINERLPDVELKMENLQSYWIEESLPKSYCWAVEIAFQDKEMWKKVHLIDGAAMYIEKLYKEGHEIYFATATTPENFKKKIKFLTRSFPFFPDGYVYEHSINIKNKGLLRVDVLVDDYLENLLGKDRTYLSICLDYPWNQTENDIPNFARAKNWEEIYNIIKNI